MAPMRFLLCLLLTLAGLAGLAALASAEYNVVNFGARGDGMSDSTRGFISAWAAACGSSSPATIRVPQGNYLIKKATFDGPCRNNRITIFIGGTLVASSNYVAYGNGYWLLFNNVKGVTVVGGTLDGKGSGLWACKAAGRNCPDGAKGLTFNNAQDIVIYGLKSINSQLYHIGINGCKNVNIRGVQLMASSQSPNTDGIHVQLSAGITIANTGIKTGDDCISIGPGTVNMWMERIACGPGHGISIGSLAKDFNEAGVQNITVKSAVFTGTQNGVRIKSWGRPSSGFVRGVTFMDVIMVNVNNPIIIDQNYCPRNEGCPNQHSGIKISDVKYENIRGTSATEMAVTFECSAAKPCNGIGLENVKLTYQHERAQSICKYVDGTARGLVDPPSCL